MSEEKKTEIDSESKTDKKTNAPTLKEIATDFEKGLDTIAEDANSVFQLNKTLSDTLPTFKEQSKKLITDQSKEIARVWKLAAPDPLNKDAKYINQETADLIITRIDQLHNQLLAQLELQKKAMFTQIEQAQKKNPKQISEKIVTDEKKKIEELYEKTKKELEDAATQRKQTLQENIDSLTRTSKFDANFFEEDFAKVTGESDIQPFQLQSDYNVTEDQFNEEFAPLFSGRDMYNPLRFLSSNGELPSYKQDVEETKTGFKIELSNKNATSLTQNEKFLLFRGLKNLINTKNPQKFIELPDDFPKGGKLDAIRYLAMIGWLDKKRFPNRNIKVDGLTTNEITAAIREGLNLKNSYAEKHQHKIDRRSQIIAEQVNSIEEHLGKRTHDEDDEAVIDKIEKKLVLYKNELDKLKSFFNDPVQLSEASEKTKSENNKTLQIIRTNLQKIEDHLNSGKPFDQDFLKGLTPIKGEKDDLEKENLLTTGLKKEKDIHPPKNNFTKKRKIETNDKDESDEKIEKIVIKKFKR